MADELRRCANPNCGKPIAAAYDLERFEFLESDPDNPPKPEDDSQLCEECDVKELGEIVVHHGWLS